LAGASLTEKDARTEEFLCLSFLSGSGLASGFNGKVE